MKTLLRLLDFLLAVLTMAFCIGVLIALVPYSLIVPELGYEGVRIQLSGAALAAASFVTLVVIGLFRAFTES